MTDGNTVFKQARMLESEFNNIVSQVRLIHSGNDSVEPIFMIVLKHKSDMFGANERKKEANITTLLESLYKAIGQQRTTGIAHPIRIDEPLYIGGRHKESLETQNLLADFSAIRQKLSKYLQKKQNQTLADYSAIPPVASV